MSYLRECEKTLISQLKQTTGVEVYVHAPDDAKMPYVHIHDFSSSKWLLIENSHKLKLNVTVYSEATSNQEVISICEKMSNTAKNIEFNNIRFSKTSVDSIEIFQLKNGIWCGSISLKLNLIEI